MKQGMTQQELSVEVARQLKGKEDYIGDTRQFTMTKDTGGVRLMLAGNPVNYPLRKLGHRQLSDHVRIPARYYDRMLEDTESHDLLLRNVNHWFEHNPARRMVRTLDGTVRAFLSDRYRPLDNYDLIEAVLPEVSASGATLESCNLSEDRLYIKAVIQEVQREILPPVGPAYSGNSSSVIVSPGVVISNSEVGLASIAVQPAVHFLACTNMAVWATHALRKYHVGRQFNVDFGGEDKGNGDVRRFITDDTRQLEDAAVWSAVRDLARGALQGDIFEQIVKDIRAARGDLIDEPILTVEKLANKYDFTEPEQNGVLHHMMMGHDLSRYGLSQAVTRFSQDIESYDRASHLEQIGGEIFALDRDDWHFIRN